MLKPIFIVSIIISTFYLLPIASKKRDFNAIANPNKVQKIEEFLAKEKAKIMAKRDAENDMKSMEDENNITDKIKNAEILRTIFYDWYITVNDKLIMLDGNINQISTVGLKKVINNRLKNSIVANSALLTEMYSDLSNAIDSTEMSVDNISKKFVTVLNKYNFSTKGSIDSWFKKNEKVYKATSIVNFQSGAFLDLTEAINVAQKENSSLINFQNWYNQNKKSLQVLGKDSIGYISLEKLCNRVTNCYGGILGCEFIPSYLLNGIDKTITKAAPKDIIMRLDANLDNFYYNASHTQKLSLCMTVDSTGALGEFILQSLSN